MSNTNIAIIGGGFCGMMTAVYLLQLNRPLDITVINSTYPFGKGVAYSAHTDKYLLNVRAVNMSAFEQDRYHFLEWLLQQPAYQPIPKNILTNVYAPRSVYGKYLQHIWQQALEQKHPDAAVHIIEQTAVDIQEHDDCLHIYLDNSKAIYADAAVLATGNTAPRDVNFQNNAFLQSDKYFSNPWAEACVSHVSALKNILIVGNGLTMIDTVQGIIDNGFKGRIYTISPNGFKLLPHKYNLMVYDKIVEELPAAHNLRDLFLLVRRHIKALTAVGIGAHLVIDALRPFTRQAWQNLSLNEKKFFIRKLSHAWTVLRHRVPVHIFEMIQQMRMQQRLVTIAGKITGITESTASATVTYYDNHLNKESIVYVERVINCTGPECDIRHSANALLRNLAASGIIVPDVLCLGIEADAITGAVVNNKGEKSNRIYTTGSNLKGILWENTAVPDIRVHVKQLAMHLAGSLE